MLGHMASEASTIEFQNLRLLADMVPIVLESSMTHRASCTASIHTNLYTMHHDCVNFGNLQLDAVFVLELPSRPIRRPEAELVAI